MARVIGSRVAERPGKRIEGEVGVVLLGGVEVEDRDVLRLAGAVQHRTLSRKLNMAWTLRSPVLNLTVSERETILATLADAPTGLEGLHDLLLANQAWQLRERL